MSGPADSLPESETSRAAHPPAERFEFRSTLRTDRETAELIRDTCEAAGNALAGREFVSERGWLLLVAAAALARAELDRRREAA